MISEHTKITLILNQLSMKNNIPNDIKKEIDFLFLTMHDELKWFNLKNIGFLYMNSILLNMKTIVFYALKNSYCIKEPNKLNNSNFYLYPTELESISHEEFIDFEEGVDIKDENIRRNHFSQENHIILYENIKKMINNDYTHIPFVKNICKLKK